MDSLTWTLTCSSIACSGLVLVLFWSCSGLVLVLFSSCSRQLSPLSPYRAITPSRRVVVQYGLSGSTLFLVSRMRDMYDMYMEQGSKEGTGLRSTPAAKTFAAFKFVFSQLTAASTTDARVAGSRHQYKNLYLPNIPCVGE